MEHFLEALKENIDALEDFDLKPDTALSKLPDWDSLAVLSMMAVVSSEYAVALTAKEILAADTPENIYKLAQSKKS